MLPDSHQRPLHGLTLVAGCLTEPANRQVATSIHLETLSLLCCRNVHRPVGAFAESKHPEEAATFEVATFERGKKQLTIDEARKLVDVCLASELTEAILDHLGIDLPKPQATGPPVTKLEE